MNLKFGFIINWLRDTLSRRSSAGVSGSFHPVCGSDFRPVICPWECGGRFDLYDRVCKDKKNSRQPDKH